MYTKPLFYELQTYPEGFTFTPEFMTLEEESELLEVCKTLDYHPHRYQGYDAKRQVHSFTKRSGYPSFLREYLRRVAAWMSVSPNSFEHVMVTEYAPGTQLGWHRDQPPYERIFGISLGSSVPFRLRRRTGAGWERMTVLAERRSLYGMSGPARYEWQHSIAPVEEWRYSITMRTAM